jgi:uncharacterized membrane protein
MGPLHLPKSSTGLDPRVAGLLCYLLGFITGLIFLTIEKDSRFVKFHAMQSVLVSLALLLLHIILGLIPFLGWIFGLFISPLTLILWIVLMLFALQGKWFKLPFIGDAAEQQANKF